MRPLIVEHGMGADVHGHDYTKAALRGVSDAIRHSSLTLFYTYKHPGEMRVEVRVGVQEPDKVDKDQVARALPFGTVEVTVVKGGLDDAGMGGVGDIALAAVTVKAWLDTTGPPVPAGRLTAAFDQGRDRMSWLDSSYMGRQGVAGGREGARHRVTEADQGTFHYVYGPYADPVLKIAPGDIIEVETADAFEGVIKSEDDKPSELLNFPFLNPQSGPFEVEGAEIGDALAVRIIDVDPRGPQPVGTTALIPEFGGLVGTAQTAMLNAPLPERVKKMEVTRDHVKFSDRVTLPFEPFIGTLGVSPTIEAVSSLQPDYWGGNMDLPDMAPGAIAYFPVLHKGALLYVGDCHGRQGDGELCGVAVEIPATVTLQVDLIKGWTIPGVRLENEEFIMSVGSARPMEDAARIAYRDLIRWLVADYGFEESEAYFLCTQAGRVRLGNMVDPKYSLGASMKKAYLEE